MPPAGERRPISSHNRKRDGPCGPSLFLWESLLYSLTHMGASGTAGAPPRRCQRHPPTPLGDGEGFQIPAADQRRPAEGGLWSTDDVLHTAKVLHLSRNTVAKHMRLLEEHGLIITEWTQIQMKNGIRKNGNLRCTIVPMHEVLEQCYQRQMTELERQRVQQKLSVQSTETICPPL